MKTLIPLALLLSLMTGCAQLNQTENQKSTNQLIICPAIDGYQFQTSCQSPSRLTPVTTLPLKLQSEPINNKEIKESMAVPSFTLFFGDNKYEPSQTQRRALKDWIETNRSLLNNHSVVKIEAYTSANGSMSHNNQLAEARALSVQKILNEHKLKKIQVSTSAKCCRTGESETLMSLDRKVVLSIQ